VTVLRSGLGGEEDPQADRTRRRRQEEGSEVTGDDNESTVVSISFPPQARLVRMARLASSALATAAGADVETIDDVKIAVDEVCAALIEVSDGSPVELTFALDGARLALVGETSSQADLEVDADRFMLSRQILRAIAEEHQLSSDGGRVRFSLACLVRTPANGA
jgi:hypothetical protein